MPKLTDAELCRQFGIRILKELIAGQPEVHDWDAMVAMTKCTTEVSEAVERMVETVTRRKVV